MDQYGQVRRNAIRPKAKKASEYGLTDREVLTMSVIMMWRCAPEFSGSRTMVGQDMYKWSEAVIRLWDAPYDNAVKASLAVNSRLGTEAALNSSPTDPNDIIVQEYFIDSLYVRYPLFQNFPNQPQGLRPPCH